MSNFTLTNVYKVDELSPSEFFEHALNMHKKWMLSVKDPIEHFFMHLYTKKTKRVFVVILHIVETSPLDFAKFNGCFYYM